MARTSLALYEALASGDMDRYRERFSERIVWHVPGDNPAALDRIFTA